MDQVALQFLARYATPPLSKGLCGRPDDLDSFLRCARHGECDGIEARRAGLKTVSVYLETLRRLGLESPLEQLEAYWHGSDFLAMIWPSHFGVYVSVLEAQGSPKNLLQDLRNNPPRFFVPHHAFQVLMGSKRKGDQSEASWEDVNQCLIRRGEVLAVRPDGIDVMMYYLERSPTGLQPRLRPETLQPENSLVTELKRDDVVSVHWGWVCQGLTEDQEDTLLYWTNRVVESYEDL